MERQAERNRSLIVLIGDVGGDLGAVEGIMRTGRLYTGENKAGEESQPSEVLVPCQDLVEVLALKRAREGTEGIQPARPAKKTRILKKAATAQIAHLIVAVVRAYVLNQTWQNQRSGSLEKVMSTFQSHWCTTATISKRCCCCLITSPYSLCDHLEICRVVS